MTTTRELRCPTCGAPLSLSAHEVDPPSCLYCGAASSLTRPRAFHPLRRDEETWSTPHRAAPAQHALTQHAPTQHTPSAAPTQHAVTTSAQQAPHEAAQDGHVTAAQGEWSLVLESISPYHKIDAIKLLRECSGWGLLESKNAVEAPGGLIPLSAGQSLDSIRRRFEAIKCTVTFNPGSW